MNLTAKNAENIHHDGTKDTKDSEIILLNFVTFVVSPLFFARFLLFVVKTSEASYR